MLITLWVPKTDVYFGCGADEVLFRYLVHIMDIHKRYKPYFACLLLRVLIIYLAVRLLNLEIHLIKVAIICDLRMYRRSIAVYWRQIHLHQGFSTVGISYSSRTGRIT